MNRLPLQALLFLCVLLLCGSCSRKGDMPALRYPSELALAECIAILPLENDSDTEKAGRIVADIMATELLASKKFRVMFRDETEGRIRNQNISTAIEITPRFAAILGEIFGVDAVLHGAVKEFHIQPFGKDRKPEARIAIEARLVSARSGAVIWEKDVRITPGTQPFTYNRSLAAQTQSMAREMVSSLSGKLPERVINFSRSCGKPVDSLDLDSDNMLNIVDRCPLEGGSVPHDGCPEKTIYTDLARLIGDRIFLSQPVSFIGDGAEIAPPSIPPLKGVAELLKNNHFLTRIMVESYVTEKGAAETVKLREELAFSRAQAVKDFLVSMGVAAERLVAVGYGEIDQLGKPRNPIEFHIIGIDRSQPR